MLNYFVGMKNHIFVCSHQSGRLTGQGWQNWAPSDVNIKLNGNTYLPLVKSQIGLLIFLLADQNTTGYVLDQCCHLQDGGALMMS